MEDNLFSSYSEQEDNNDDNGDASDDGREEEQQSNDGDCLSDNGIADDEVLNEPELIKSRNNNQRSSDQEIKQYCISVPFCQLASCNPNECKYGGNCVDMTSIGDMRKMKKDFWGDFDDQKAPSTSDRRLLILQILRSAYRQNENEFQFYAGQKECNNRIVCEAGFLILLGLINVPNASRAPSQWRKCKAYIRNGNDKAGIKYQSEKSDAKLKRETSASKLFNAMSFIEYFTKEFGDTIPGENGNRNDCLCSIQLFMM